jgi:hypothetical protein
MSLYTDLIGKEGIKTDVTVTLDKSTIINFGLAIFISVIASYYVIKMFGLLTKK